MATTFNPADVYSTSKPKTSNPWGSPSVTSQNAGPSNVAGFQMPDFTNVLGNQRTGAQRMFGNQDIATGQALQGYAGAIGGQETAQAMWDRLADETGYRQAMKQATDIGNQLAMVPQTMMGLTRGQDVNANQLQNAMNMQTWKLAPIQQRAQAQAQSAGQLMQQQIGALQQQQAKELTPYQQQQQFLADRLARETSMFTQQNQNELNALTAKMQTGAQLSSAEQDRLNQLRIAQEGYRNELQKTQMGLQNVQIAPGSTYFNPVTGYAYNPYQKVARP